MDYKLKILYVEINVYVKLPLIVPVDTNLCYPPCYSCTAEGLLCKGLETTVLGNLI